MRYLKSHHALKQEAPPSTRWSSSQLDVKNYFGHSLLHIVALNGLTRICRVLVEKGFGVNSRDGSLQTPFHQAAEREYLGVAETLISFDADVRAKDNEGRTPFHLAVGKGHL